MIEEIGKSENLKGEERELDEKAIEKLLLWSFYFSQGAGGFLRTDEDGNEIDADEQGLHCMIFEYIATKHPEYRIAKDFKYTEFLNAQIPRYQTFLARGSHNQIDPEEVAHDVELAYRYLHMALNDRKYMRREITEPSKIRIAQKMLDRDWKFLTNMMTIGSIDFSFAERPERTIDSGKGFEGHMSQFVHYILIRKRGEPVDIQMSPHAPRLVSPPEFIELLDSVADALQAPDIRRQLNVKSSEFDGTYKEHLKVLIDRHNVLNPSNQVPVENYRHLLD